MVALIFLSWTICPLLLKQGGFQNENKKDKNKKNHSHQHSS